MKLMDQNIFIPGIYFQQEYVSIYFILIGLHY